jgi:YfiH family protein
VRRADAPGLHRDCDALVTTVPGLVVAVTAADCLPLLYSAPGAVAAAHAGWRGIAAGVAEAALREIARAAAVAPEVVAIHLGPCIRPCCYEVGEDVATRFPAAAVRRDAARPRLDLARAVRLRLAEHGVPEARIHDCSVCTACDPATYFSHRRDRGLTGRQWGLAALRP